MKGLAAVFRLGDETASGHVLSNPHIPTDDGPLTNGDQPRDRSSRKALELLLQRETLTMEAVVIEFGLLTKMSVGGISASVRNSVTEAGFVSADAYRVETTSTGKRWTRTARTGEVLQALREKLDKLQRAH